MSLSKPVRSETVSRHQRIISDMFQSQASPKMTTTNENGDEIGVRVNDKGFLAFVGCDVQIKVTDDMPRRIGVYSTIANVCDVNDVNARQIWCRLKEDFPEIFKELVIPDVVTDSSLHPIGYSMYQFKGQGQRLTPVIDLRTWVKLVLKLRSKKAASFQDFVADLVVRYLGGWRLSPPT